MAFSQISTPDFDTYPVRHRVTAVDVIEHGVRVTWSDGLCSGFNRFWLRENAADPATTHPVTRELTLPLLDVPDNLAVSHAEVSGCGGIIVIWSTGDTSEYHPGWLRAWCHEASGEMFQLPERLSWDASALPQVPRFNGPDVLIDEACFAAWCHALHVHGVAIVENLPANEQTIEDVPARIGPIRPTNFGFVFDVKDVPDATSNAYTTMTLPLHADLCTREYMPGLQFLFCIENSADGGVSQLADGFKIVAQLRADYPQHFETLTTLPVAFYNKATDSDYRFEKPIIGLDRFGEVDELRFSPWLRAPLAGSVDEVERIYQGLRTLFRLAEDRRNFVEVKLAPGDLLSFDNRRILHGRTGFDLKTGERWLRGCYLEREELHSRLRILARHKRERAAG